MNNKGCWYDQYYWIENEYTGEIICIKKDSPDGEEYRKEFYENLKLKSNSNNSKNSKRTNNYELY